jgi:hypothetical protein
LLGGPDDEKKSPIRHLVRPILLLVLSLVVLLRVLGDVPGKVVEDKRGPSYALHLEGGDVFLSVEPGCGRYKVRKIGSSGAKSLYLVESRMGAPVDERGEITGKDLAGRYLVVTLGGERIREVTVFDQSDPAEAPK